MVKGCKMPPENDRNLHLEQFCKSLEEQLGSRRFRHWFATASQFTLQGGELTVQVSSPYLLKFIQQKFHGLLTQLAAAHLGPQSLIRYESGRAVTLQPPVAKTDADAPTLTHVARTSVARTSAPVEAETAGKKAAARRRLADLGQFVVGSGNDLAYMAVRQVVEQPAAVSPVYIHATVGMGKTHLLEGTCRQLRREFPTLQTLLITAEQFCNYFTQALSAKTLPSFRQRFRNVDVMLVDDVDFLDGKHAIQEEFLHTLKRLHEEGKQVVVTSSRHPRMLLKTSDELITRYLAGLVCRIEALDDQTRQELARRYAVRLRLNIVPAAIDFIASRFRDNVREIEGALNVLQTWSTMTGQRVTQGAARELLARLHRDSLRIIRVADIEKVVCETYAVSAEELRSDSRRATVAQPRMLAMYLARRLTQAAYSEIGSHFGGRNHSTVMSAEKRIQQQLSQGATVRIGGQELPLQEMLATLEDRVRAV